MHPRSWMGVHSLTGVHRFCATHFPFAPSITFHGRRFSPGRTAASSTSSQPSRSGSFVASRRFAMSSSTNRDAHVEGKPRSVGNVVFRRAERVDVDIEHQSKAALGVVLENPVSFVEALGKRRLYHGFQLDGGGESAMWAPATTC